MQYQGSLSCKGELGLVMDIVGGKKFCKTPMGEEEEEEGEGGESVARGRKRSR